MQEHVMTHIPLDPKLWYMENLRKLGEFLYNDPRIPGVQFNMAWWGSTEYADTCGTSGCAVGWAPFAGIQKNSGESWSVYISRQFTRTISPKGFNWMFGGEWKNIDNTPRGAGKRILYALERGIPEVFNHRVGYEVYKDFIPSCPRLRKGDLFVYASFDPNTREITRGFEIS